MYSDKAKNEANSMIDFYSNHPQFCIGFTNCISLAIDKQESVVKVYTDLYKMDVGLSVNAHISYSHETEKLNYLRSKL